MSDWQTIWKRIADGASRTPENPPDEMPNGFAAGVLAELDRRKHHASLRTENRLTLTASFVSMAAALVVAVWCRDAVLWYTDATPVALQDIINLEPKP